MTREEAIKHLNNCKKYSDTFRASDGVEVSKGMCIALDMAIKSLEQEPIYYPPCQDCHTKVNEIVRAYNNVKSLDDAVSRQGVKEQMLKYGFHAPDMTVTEFVEDLPPVIPKRERSDN